MFLCKQYHGSGTVKIVKRPCIVMHHFPQSLVLHQSQITSSEKLCLMILSLKLAHSWRALTTEPGDVWLFNWYLK